MAGGPWWVADMTLDAMLDELAGSGILVAPVRVGDETVFRRVASASEICRDYVNTLVPPKRFFLPTPELLAAYRLDDGRPTLLPSDDEPDELVLFGARSCDVAGLACLERFFAGTTLDHPETADTPFLARRARATVLSVVCDEAGPNCMCVCCRGGPALDAGYDWQLTAVRHGWLVEVGSARGETLAERFRARLRAAPPEALREKGAVVRAMVEDFHRRSTHRVQSMAAGRLVSRGRLPHEFWDALGEHCVECGGCSYVCPTCSCFTVADLPATGAGRVYPAEDGEPAVPGGPVRTPADGTYERVRLRDGCTMAGFVRQAGGSYPRAARGERCRTRFFHKLSWQTVDRSGTLGCTGCGRCAQVCLGGIGIDHVSALMTEALVHTAKGA
jgi:formate hydrogenlyase subunit 6/NADH:ubiquinone oxidoreductase subunit I